jgi:hypothetical protein
MTGRRSRKAALRKLLCGTVAASNTWNTLRVMATKCLPPFASWGWKIASASVASFFYRLT